MNLDFLFLLIPAFLNPIILSLYYHLPLKKVLVIISSIFIFVCTGLIYFQLELSLQFKIILVLLTNLLGLSFFIFIFFKTQNQSLTSWIDQLKEKEKEKKIQEQKRKELKEETQNLEKDITRTLRLYGVIKGLGEALTWDEMIPHIDYAVTHCLGLKDYHLYLSDESNHLQKVISRGYRLPDFSAPSVSAVPRLHESTQKANETLLEISIYHGEQYIGLLWGRISSFNKIPKEEILNEAVELSENLGMGLQKARLFSSLEKLSRVDGLTGVYRRRVFDERINEELRRAQIFHNVFSILIADLDHFKNINDTYGHQGGDEVLRRVGKIFRESVYETDSVARYGGEEFVILFPQADPEGVQRKAEALRSRIENERFTLGWNKIQVTTSIGLAHYPTDGHTLSQLLASADQCLYTAKNAGRNTIIDSSQLPPQK